MSHSNFYTDPQVALWKKLVGFLVLFAILFVFGAFTGFVGDGGSGDALRQGYVFVRAGLVMLFVILVVQKVCKILQLGEFPSSMIGFASAMGSMQATCDALNGKYDEIAASGLNGIVTGAFCGAMIHWMKRPQADASRSSNMAQQDTSA